MARGLIHEWGNAWVPLFQASQTDLAEEEMFWPIGVFGDKFIVIRCKKVCVEKESEIICFFQLNLIFLIPFLFQDEPPAPRSAKAISVTVPLSLPVLQPKSDISKVGVERGKIRKNISSLTIFFFVV